MKFNLSKLFLFLVLLSILLIVLTPIEDPDFWWHLKTGEIIAQEHKIPHFDNYSFTAAGKPWIAHEWVSELIIFKLYTIGGLILPIIVFSILMLIAFGLTIFRCENRTNLYIVGSSLFLGAIMSTPILWARPQIFTILYMSIFLLLLDSYLKTGKFRYLFPLPVFMLFWVNQHGAFIVGLGIIAIFILGRLIDSILLIYREKREFKALFDKSFWVLSITLTVCTLVTLINPNGARILIYPFQTLSDSSMQTLIKEWASPDFSKRNWIPLAAMFLGLIGIGLKSKQSISTINLILCLVFGYAALSAVRHVALFALVAIPVLSDQTSMAVHFQYNRMQRDRFVKPFSLLVLCGAFFMFIYIVSALEKKQEDVIQNNFPVNAVNYIKKNKLNGRMFNTYQWGGYLIWNLYPEQKVYIDGRADVYGADFVAHAYNIYMAKPDWKKSLDDEKIQFVLVGPETPLAYGLQISADWKLIFNDELSVLYERK